MPIIQPKDNEKQNDYMNRCMHKINKDNPKMPNKQQVAICLNTYSNPKKKAKANEIEIDMTEDIKNLNKAEEVKTEAKAELDGKGEVIQTTLMQMQNQYKILHWQTMSFSQHESFDKIVSSLSENIDEFIETYMGKYGRVIAAGTFNINLANYKDTDFVALTNNYIEFLIGLSNVLDKIQDSDLLNIRDEILGSLNQLKYLLTLV